MIQIANKRMRIYVNDTEYIVFFSFWRGTGYTEQEDSWVI